MLKPRKFQRKKENFKCLNCGTEVAGTGYTDHCPVCLWSRHVDINPGDRAEKCRGLLEPVGVEVKAGGYVICYKCRECGFRHRVRASGDDNMEELIKLSANIM